MAASSPDTAPAAPKPKRDRTHYLYIAVIVAVALGITVGLVAPDFAVELKPIGTGFVNLIKMMISPIIFCTIVLGIGSVRKAAKVGAVGGIALAYFTVMSLVALGIGLVVGNILEPGTGLARHRRGQGRRSRADRRGGQGHHRVPARHHPDDVRLRLHRGRGPADPADRPARRVRAAGHGLGRPAGPARCRAHPAARLPRPRHGHVGRPARRLRRDGGRRRLRRCRRPQEPRRPDARLLRHLLPVRLHRARHAAAGGGRPEHLHALQVPGP